MKHGQIIMGPAGCGKSTFSARIQEHVQAKNRNILVVNLDPAAEHFNYDLAIDIRDLISVEDAMEEMQLGPNGGLVFCMEYLANNLEWLKDRLDEYGEESYFLFDCPGQIELYSHVSVMPRLCENLQQWGFRICGVYLMDAMFLTDASKFISATVASMCCMLQLQLPHINVITKCDLATNLDAIDKYLTPGSNVLGDLNEHTPPQFRALNAALCGLLDDFSMVSYVMLDPTNEDSAEEVLAHIEMAIQYGEDAEPKMPDELQADDLPDAPSGIV
jgi:GTPase SAR1 family protein